MLRPATPLTILLFAAFVLLMISVISTPIIKQIPLASYGGVDFGVFGYCEASGCSPIEVGYSTRELAHPLLHRDVRPVEILIPCSESIQHGRAR